MQENILLFFNNYTSGLADFLAHTVSFCAEAVIPLFVVCTIYWAVNKRVGINLAYCLGLSILINTIVKIFVRAARPFEKLPELKAGRLGTATGYSFPSTHSQTIATFMTSLSLYVKRGWIIVVTVFALLAVGLSRLYFCVHWPVDVMCGLLFGTIIGFVVYRLLERILSVPSADVMFASSIFVLSVIIFCLLLLVYYRLQLYPLAKIADNFKITGLVAGISLGNLLEMCCLRFEPASTTKNKILTIVLGFVGAGVIYGGLKLLLPVSVFSYFARYFIVGFWVAAGWPFIAVKCGFLTRG